MSDTFCVLAWRHLHVNTQGQRTLCCDSREHLLNFGYFNTNLHFENPVPAGLQEVRKKMLEGQKVPACHVCYQNEESGIFSARQYYNQMFADQIPKILTQQEVTSDQVISIDFRGDNKCNFRCRTCNPDYSSALDAEAQRHFAHPKPLKPDPVSLLELSRQMDLSKVRRIYFAGGEPLLAQDHLQFLADLVSKKRTDIDLVYTTNGSLLARNDFQILKIWSQFDRVVFGFSLDAWGPRAEYIRHGTDWAKLLQDLKFAKSQLKKAYIFASITVSVFNVLILPELIENLVAEGLIRERDLHLHLVYQPEEFNINSLGPAFRLEALSTLNRLIAKYEKLREARVLDLLRGLCNHLDIEKNCDLRPVFLKRINAFDRIRNENFRETFPELQKFLNSGINSEIL
jgi:organic radical activating enzyme